MTKRKSSPSAAARRLPRWLFICLVVAGILGCLGLGGWAAVRLAQGMIVTMRTPVMIPTEYFRAMTTMQAGVDSVTSSTPVPAPDLEALAGQAASAGSRAGYAVRLEVLKVLIGAADAGCALRVEQASVIREPDAAGVWVEEWVLSSCGGNRTYEVTFTPEGKWTSFTVDRR